MLGGEAFEQFAEFLLVMPKSDDSENRQKRYISFSFWVDH